MNVYVEGRKELARYGFSEEVIQQLKSLLTPENYTGHMKARETFVSQGAKILPVMHKLAESPSVAIRMEAALIVKLIAHRSSIPVAIRLLEDEEGDIRWIAAEILIAVGRPSLRPLFRELVDQKATHYLRLGVHHVLSELIRADDPEELHEFYQKGLNDTNRPGVVVKASEILSHKLV